MNAPEAQPGSGEVNRLQRWFQAVITHSEGVEAGASSEEAQKLFQLAPGQLERVITRSRALTAAERLAIYANAYNTRLLECLGEVFPLLKRTLGDDAFDGLAFGYLQDYPSKSYTLNELGRHFPRYLEQTRPVDSKEQQAAGAADSEPEHALTEDWPDFLIDLARLEWAIYEVFDGPGVEGQALLSADQILAVDPASWPLARLVPVACLQLLATRFPVNDFFTASRRANIDESVPIPAACDSFVALTRRQFIVRRYNLSKPEFELLRVIQEGRPIGEAIECAAMSTTGGVDSLANDLQLWFRNWTAEGFFRAVKMPS